jgi:hypothetical protein
LTRNESEQVVAAAIIFATGWVRISLLVSKWASTRWSLLANLPGLRQNATGGFDSGEQMSSLKLIGP